MIVNDNIKPRPLTEAELADLKRGAFDSYANYIVFCGKCGRMQKTNMYVMRAEAYIDELNAAGKTCPNCGAKLEFDLSDLAAAAEDGEDEE